MDYVTHLLQKGTAYVTYLLQKKGTLDKNSDYSHGFGDICTYFNNLEYVSHKNVYLIKHETTKCVKPFRWAIQISYWPDKQRIAGISLAFYCNWGKNEYDN